MHILIAAIGKLKSGPEQSLYNEYIARLKWKVSVKEFDMRKSLKGDVGKTQEAEFLLHAVADTDHLIALDERGKDMTSAAFAAHLGKCRDNGVGAIGIVIGGADGLDESVRKKAHLVLSFGKLTWPHLLVRPLLAEQLYRAYSILNHHPYHRE